MGNAYYAPDATRATKVSALFARIAPRYDLINDLQSFGLHRLWKRRLVRLAAARPGLHALDLCCGTGDVAFALARAGAGVTGLDFSEEMLAMAKQRKPSAGTGQVEFLHGDALQTPFPDAHFDVVTISYGLRNLADFTGGLREMHRVTRPGGRLVILDFGKPPNRLWRSLYFGYLRFAVPVFGRIFCGDAAAYAYILESLQHYPAQEGVATALRELGCANVGVTHLLGGAMSLNYAEKAR
ncbi:MAG: bifunctional demethylmenaquinone methyltransferase/2-methoxy-6-polyprenyl-1,4-benzoquinol methylase UbiE [Pedosphaera sp.]|nr:bifunctional demethylmenaquinone methyltransferase/2-methoxy-6-polyprenyl-1,4-benzoquinol methylase UbiE [Pedosphaera sp.]MST00622.1 bifunctional demethylmenaquinone methyltransferase/2-methoxy-6-polyprenyl-1,4-benzoquinol methylase UbiE [Pedosphaera sp.]